MQARYLHNSIRSYYIRKQQVRLTKIGDKDKSTVRFTAIKGVLEEHNHTLTEPTEEALAAALPNLSGDAISYAVWLLNYPHCSFATAVKIVAASYPDLRLDENKQKEHLRYQVMPKGGSAGDQRAR